MNLRFSTLATPLVAFAYGVCMPCAIAAAASPAQVDALCVEADLPTALKMLADSEPAAIDNRVRRPLSSIRLTSRTTLAPEHVRAGLTELLLLRGVAVTRSADGLVAEDTPDPSEAIVLAVRDKSLAERAPQLMASLAAGGEEPVRFAVADMALVDLLPMVQLLTGRSLLVDDPLPRARFSSPDSTRGRAEILGEVDAFLVKNGVYLVEHDARFVKVVCAPALLARTATLPEGESMAEQEVRQRMERVAAEIRARRERRQKLIEENSGGSSVPASTP